MGIVNTTDMGKTFKNLAKKRADIDRLSREVGVKTPGGGGRTATRIVDKKRKAEKGGVLEVGAEAKVGMEKAKEPSFKKERSMYNKARDTVINVIKKMRGERKSTTIQTGTRG